MTVIPFNHFIRTMLLLYVAAAVLFVFLLAMAAFGTVLVRSGEHVLRESCGQQLPPLTRPGFHVSWPWEYVVFRAYPRQSLLLDTEPIKCRSKDRLEIIVDTFVYYCIANPAAAYYSVDNYKEAMKLHVESFLVNAVATLRVHEINNVTLDLALSKLQRDGHFKDWGIELGETRIQNIKLPESIAQATQEEVRQHHRATVEQQRVESELALEKQRLEARGVKEDIERKLEHQRLQARVEQQRLEKERAQIENAAHSEFLAQLKERDVLDAYVELERQETVARIFQSKHAPRTIFMPGSGDIMPVLRLDAALPLEDAPVEDVVEDAAPTTPQRRRKRQSIGARRAVSVKD